MVTPSDRKSVLVVWFIASLILWVIGMIGVIINLNDQKGYAYKSSLVVALIGVIGATACLGASL
jgi:hypothetical protein